MKKFGPLIGCWLLLSASVALCQDFDSGSDGSMGGLEVLTDTVLDVPPDGRFHFTTINIAGGSTLRFRRNANNTPIYLLAQGSVTLSGDIFVSGTAGNQVIGGAGGPGGFDGGNPGSVSSAPGDGFGPGGGGAGTGTTTGDGAGSGSFSTVSASGNSTRHGSVYGNALLIPPIGGSGGGGTQGTPGSGGGGGGGALVLASSVSIAMTSTAADIFADGGNAGGGAWNGGSGGSIRLVAPIISGTGRLFARAASGAGQGRIRVDLLDRSNFSLTLNPIGSTSVGSLMVVDPVPLPKLDITNAAGTSIAVGSGPVTIVLPFGSNPSQAVTVRATGFNAVVPITIMLTPDNGSRNSFDAQIDNLAADPASTTVNVQFPVNVQTTVHVWTR